MDRERELELELDELIRARGLTLREMLEWDRDLARSPKAHLSDCYDVWERNLYRWRKATEREPDPAKRARMKAIGDASEGRMGETKYNTSHHAGATPEARIANRLRNSGDAQHADHHARHGTGPTRTDTNIHHSRNQQYGEGHFGEGDITGKPRGVV